MCNTIVNYTVSFLKRKTVLNSDEISIIKYQLTVVIYELAELISLIIFAVIVEKLKEFIVSYFVVVLIRSRIGGIHHNSYAGCYLHTMLFFVLIIILSMHIDKELNNSLWIMCAIIDWLFAPLPSKNRGILSKKTTRRIKITIYISMIAIFAFSLVFPDYKNIILITLTMIHTELLARCVIERRKPCLNGYVI